ncbi:tyrosine/phenylalanine carboxypeptidase domain-containing protein [Euzebya tangerina]|uniref:tyrosine/phenylalanine carboxypeptidase domain-containing protein n=1 Tax=Euzebya tangerina TaxID=591198 RepID=UPI000E30D0E7|nr:tyrosine/phenylalanine carboxypeptidase domain-containing protein [Euzebya tangerina]
MNHLSTSQPTPPQPGAAARAVDAALVDLDREIDWLARVSPTGNDARWRTFVANDFQFAPPLTYEPLELDCEAVRYRLDSLPLAEIDEPTFAVLLAEKADELRRQVRLLECRDTPAFVAASIDLFGEIDRTLLDDAETILSDVPERSPTGPRAGADDVLAEAQRCRAEYAEAAPEFAFEIHVVPDTDYKLMVRAGDLYVDARLDISTHRVRPLVAHEVGVHVLTWFNGRRQPLALLQSGFGHYDALQEGLATFCEFLEGCLPPSRLRVLAARVVAADLATRATPLEEIFDVLHRSHGLPVEPAFEVAVRAKRGGGLTKDAVYLAGLRNLLSWLGRGGDLTELFVGKFALRHHHLIVDLLDRGLLRPPALLPNCLSSGDGVARLADAAERPLTALYDIDCTT